MSTTDTRAAFEKRFGPNDSFAWRDENDNYKVASLQSAWEVWQAATEVAKATGTAVQESAPAELPIKTWQERAEESGADALTVDQCMKLAETEIAELRAALSRPVVASETQINAVVDKLRDMDAGVWSRGGIPQKELIASILDSAPASPQPVAKEMNDSEIQVLAELNFYSPDDPTMDGRLRRFARAILAASTPTTLTEKKE